MSNRRKKRSSIAKNIKTKFQQRIINSQNQHVTQHTKLSNRFEPLTDMEFESGSTFVQRSPSNDKKPKIPPIPPIVITQKEFNISEIKNLNIPEITFKFISLGIKVSFGEKSSYDKCIDYLNANNVEFFTHRVNNNMFKVILSGLPQTNPDVIKEELKTKFNLNVSDVRELQTSYFNKNNRLYLLCLDKSEINLGQLKQIKVVNYTIVKWLRFSPKNKGPTQCRKCLLFGHGAENCHRKMICMFCASTEHASDACSFKSTPENSLAFRCANCQSKGIPSNHRANDSNCPCKAEYQNIRNHLRIKNSNQSNRSNQSNESSRFNQNFQQDSRVLQNQSAHLNSNQLDANAPVFSLNDNHFPAMSRSTNGNHRVPTNQSFEFKNSYSNVTKNQLLSPDEFFNIFDDALAKFYECKNATDQIALIASLLRRAIR